jgi:hypothetical protein
LITFRSFAVEEKKFPQWAKEGIRWAVGLLIVFLYTKYGIKPPEMPPMFIQASDGTMIQAKLDK